MPYGQPYRGTRRFGGQRRRLARPRRAAAATKIQRVVRRFKKKQFAKRVQRAVAPKMERKYVTSMILGTSGGVLNPGLILGQSILGNGLGNGIYSTGGLWVNDFFASIAVPQGPKNGERIGLTIQNCKLIAKVSVCNRAYAAGNNTSRFPKDLYMLVCKDRNDNDTEVDQIKNLPDGNSFWIDGSPQSLMYPFNRDKYTVYSCKRVARFGPPPVQLTSTGTTPPPITIENPTMGATTNRAFRNFTVRLPCPKTLRFTTPKAITGSVVNTPSSAHCGLGFFYVDGSGSVASSDQYPFLVTMTATLSYTDA
jgi:hypothetical protein